MGVARCQGCAKINASVNIMLTFGSLALPRMSGERIPTEDGTTARSKTERSQRKNKDGKRDAVDAEEPPTPSLEPA